MLTSNRPLAVSHAFSHLTAFIDAQGVIRVGGRLHHSDFSFETKHPTILPRHSQLSTLIIDHAHKRTLHGGTQTTLAFIRQTYWIIGGRQPGSTMLDHSSLRHGKAAARRHTKGGYASLCALPHQLFISSSSVITQQQASLQHIDALHLVAAFLIHSTSTVGLISRAQKQNFARC
ncbi:hypothetical protein KPH14_008170 [Odynerus spinipes]|uniref:Integrase zinc-binding domain-containing protein n=1 Tax=Odynerus spinipes TaxID=1348599 RepID=A0AAD9RDX5_9HYME|nr:hypothetical protein KPH14_008170 [Odynerus spinipes]